ncbi:MAG: toll/interleukin-1 receptor domain-containing protein [Alphaproteobacteria bacterium]|nr:toll/interleukin-1 receptor domain-containing protein [Alphaproteobacteria bacterium]MBU1560720.1 toll/interleukin-1 receptor domain-containing protein [Alphaproteobacteria bacterium]MBU2302929.1 toll/interleukin-1 receptor domain-containing protein [Alphaproteobacteria bacterium]MBU2367656.1 toll/interleukin-1 receptor domain-containing protein [Alphaproteobacteria bacterium]
MTTVFFSYSHRDEALRDQLETQLAMLKRQGVIETWHDRRIVAGEELDGAISAELQGADIVLLLVSPDFLASDYCYDREMAVAMERHAEGEAVVIPVILRPCEWHKAPFGKLRATPTDGRPVTQWPDRDLAMLDVVKDIRRAAERFASPSVPPAREAMSPSSSAAAPASPRSSNLRLAKTFTDRDKDRFRVEAFEFLAKYFENSLSELSQRNDGIDSDFRRIDSNRFTAAVYRSGKAVSRCTIFMGGGFSTNGISYVDGETTASSGYNENLRVDADDQSMFLRSMGMRSFGSQREEHLTLEGAAEIYWSMFIERLQGDM